MHANMADCQTEANSDFVSVKTCKKNLFAAKSHIHFDFIFRLTSTANPQLVNLTDVNANVIRKRLK